jgi:hypothetical protein
VRVSHRPPAWRAAVVLGLLFLATAAAALATQRLKDDAALVRRLHVTPTISPNGDGWRDRATIRFIPGRSDVISATIRDADGDVVRHLVQRRRVKKGRFVRLRWHGRDDAGRVVGRGAYHAQVVLHRRGRTVDVQDPIRVSRRPAHGSR